jgi:hypothetical protein
MEDRRPEQAIPARRMAEIAAGWVGPLAASAWGLPGAAGCGVDPADCGDTLVLAQLLFAAAALAVLVAFPLVARAAALATLSGLAAAALLVAMALAVGLTPPAAPLVAAGAAIVVAAYVAGGIVGLVAISRQGRASAS